MKLIAVYGMELFVRDKDIYIAIDEDGEVYSYNIKPELCEQCICWDCVGLAHIIRGLLILDNNYPWKESLIEITDEITIVTGIEGIDKL
jgi:hypothetical protein